MSETTGGGMAAEAGRGLGARLEGRAALMLCLAAAWIVLAASVALIYAGIGRLAPDGAAGSVLPNDFAAFWAAGRLAPVEGAVAVLDPARLATVQHFPATAPANTYFPFVYPPAWLVAVLPLGALPYAAAYPLFAGLSALLWAGAAWAIARTGKAAGSGGWGLTLFLVATPLLFLALSAGQTTPLWLALLVGGLLALRAGRALLGGALIGLLAFKPQLCLVIPCALLAAAAVSPGQWRAVAGAAATVVLGAALPTLYTGIDYWPAWLAMLGDQGEKVAQAGAARNAMLPWYPALRGLGLEHGFASALQWGVTALCGAGVAWAWSRRGADARLQAAVLCFAIPLAAPYAWYYEALVAVAGLGFLLAAGFGTSLAGRALVFAVWALPGPLTVASASFPLFYVTAPLLTLALAASLAAVARDAAGR
ncbi:MAG: glycosyltransferase family 87 protein [Pseudomonadota bacterium]